ncbi:MAG: IPExxxVDY family protein, partial [Bacteroidales bacterium]
MAIKRHKLEVAMEEDFCLLGVVSDEPDYRLCWMINRQLGMDFEKTDDLTLRHRKYQEEQQFSLFLFEDEEAMVTYRIIKNRADVGHFL